LTETEEQISRQQSNNSDTGISSPYLSFADENIKMTDYSFDLYAILVQFVLLEVEEDRHTMAMHTVSV